MSARPWVAWAEAQLGELAERRLLRSLRSLTPQPSPNGVAAALVGDATYQQMLDNVPSTGEVEAAAGGRRLTIFAANDYLGLSAHPAVRQAAVVVVNPETQLPTLCQEVVVMNPEAQLLTL